jgi:transcriptional regulator with XRE-family HTH domain
MNARRRVRRFPPDPIYADVGALITAARGGRTIEDVAAVLGLSRQAWSAYEGGRSAISVARLVQLAAVLGVEPASLIPDHEATPIPYVLAVSSDDLAAIRRMAAQTPDAAP